MPRIQKTQKGERRGRGKEGKRTSVSKTQEDTKTKGKDGRVN